MTGRQRAAVTLVALLATATAACSGTDAETPPPPVPTTTTTTAPSTSPPPTAEELAAQEAIAVFEASFELDERIAQAPNSRDWEPEIRRYAIDPAAAASVQAMADLREYGIRQQGASSVVPEVTGVDLVAEPRPTVSIAACFDHTTSELVYAQTGEPIPQDPNELPRWLLEASVMQLPTGQWLVSVVEPKTASAC